MNQEESPSAKRKPAKRGRAWLSQEIAIVSEHYLTGGPSQVRQFLPDRSLSAIASMATRLGLKYKRLAEPSSHYRWSPDELALLRQCYPVEGPACAERFPLRSTAAIRCMAAALGLQPPTWREEELAVLKQWYAVEGGAVAKRLPGRTKTAVYLQAQQLGLAIKAPSWTAAEKTIVQEHPEMTPTQLMALLPGRSRMAISLQRLKIKRGQRSQG